MARAHLVSTALRRGRWTLVVALALTGVTVPAGVASGASHLPTAAVGAACDRACLRADLRSDLTAYLAARGASEHVSAAGLSVRLQGQRGTVDVAAGTTRLGGGAPVTSANLWQVGSHTKAFTSVLLLQLEAEHRLSINDKLGTWLPDYSQWRSVTIKRLLNMTSGIATYDESEAFQRAFVADPRRRFTARQLVAYAESLPTTKGYSYSNTNYVLAELIIEKATHDTYAHQLRTRFLGPLHLRDTHYEPHLYPAAVIRREPAGYFANRAVPTFHPLLDHDVSRTTLSWARGAGGIISTTHDMTVWEQALYHGRLLPRRQQSELRSLVSTTTGRPIARTTPSDPQGFGLGIAQLFDPTIGRVWFYEGETLGFRTVHLYFPGSGVIFAAALNSAPTRDGIGDLVGLVYTTLVSDGVLPAPAGAQRGTASALARSFPLAS